MNTITWRTHTELLTALALLISKTEEKVLLAEDAYFIDNVNFFCKSFLITACTYLEVYLKDLAKVIINETEARLNIKPIALNIIKWSIEKEKAKPAEFKYEAFRLNISAEEIEDSISGNVGKTIDFFRKLGIDLNSESDFVNTKSLVAPIIVRRNNIVHYNDNASDLSFGDMAGYINTFIQYITSIDKCVFNHISPCITTSFVTT
jgi:hypothetical protein